MDFMGSTKRQYLSTNHAELENSLVVSNQTTNNDTAGANAAKKPKRKRIIWLDIAKGIGMFAVVCGHNLRPFVEQNPDFRYLYNFLYWWHMPLFFLIAGFFLKPIDLKDIQKVMTFLKKRVAPILKSYFLAGILLVIAYKFIHNKSIMRSMTYIIDLFYGGQALRHYTTIFWYPETYILGIIGTTVIISLIRNRPLQLLIAAYFVYWSTSYVKITKFHFFGVVTAPWDMDVAVLVMAYMLIGYNLFHFCKDYLVKWYVFVPSAVVVGWLFLQLKADKLSFDLFMRSHQISAAYENVPVTHAQLALMVGVIPILCTLVVFGISRIIAYPLGFTSPRAKIILSPFALIVETIFVTGRHSLIIMYMHKMILDIVKRTNMTSSFWLQVLIATLVPLLIGIIYRRFRRTELGQWQLRDYLNFLRPKRRENNQS